MISLVGGAKYRRVRAQMAPVPVRVQLLISLSARLGTDSDDNDVFRIHLHLDPVVSLWNPYNVRLEFDQYNFKWRFLIWRPPSRQGIPMVPPRIPPMIPLKTLISIWSWLSKAKIGSLPIETSCRFRMNADGEEKPNGLVVLEPGETRLFSASHPGIEPDYGMMAAGFSIFGKEGIEDMADEGGYEFENPTGDVIELPHGTEITMVPDISGGETLLNGSLGAQIERRGAWAAAAVNRDEYYSRSRFTWPAPGESIPVQWLDNWNNASPNKTAVAAMDFVMKGEDSEFPVPMFSQFSPRAISVINYARRHRIL